MRVTSGEVHLRGLAAGQQETSQRWWDVGDTVLDLTVPGIKMSENIFRSC